MHCVSSSPALLETEVRPRPGRPWTIGALAAAIFLLPYLGFLGTHQLWQPYEPDLVETAREMRASGDLIVPTLNGETYSEKPPLYYWSALGAAALRGRLDETAARLPSALSAVALVFVTATFGARLFGARAGIVSGLALGTTWLCFYCGTLGMCDMPLALATTGAIVATYVATCEDRPRGAALVVAGACVGVSVLAKSLLGPVIVVLATVPAILADRERRLPSWRWFALGALACLAVMAPWFLAVWRREGWEFLSNVFLHQTVRRFLGDGEAKGSGATYLGSVPVDFLPWTLFLPVAGLHAWRVRVSDAARWRTLRFLLIGIGAELVFLSFSRCRIGKYALPVFPSMALVVGALIAEAKTDLERRLVAWPSAAFAIALGAAGVVVPLVAVHSYWPAFTDLGLEGAAFATLGAAALYVVSRTAAPHAIAVALASLLVVGGVLGQRDFYPAIDEIRSDRPLEQAIETFVRPDTPFASYGLGTRAYLIYYTGRKHVPFFSATELARWRASSGARTVFVLTRKDYYGQLLGDAILGPRLEIVAQNPSGVGHDDYLLVRIQ